MNDGGVPPKPPRDPRLDLVRGWLQLTIFASHATGSWIGGWLIHGAWGLSDSSEQFVLLSGFTLGSVFARKAARDGWRAGAADLLRRTRRLYVTQLITFVLFGAMIWAAGQALPGEIARLGWLSVAERPWHALLGALTMLYQPVDMGILPVFVWCMLVLPVFAWAEARWGAWALLPSLVLYGVVQVTGLIPPSLSPETGIGFNPFAWQVLFLIGAWLGRRALLLGEALPRRRWPTMLAVLVVALGVFLRLAWYGWLPWPAPVAEGAAWVGKESLALPRVLHALALAWLVAALVPREAGWMHSRAVAWLAAVGRHSLYVFCLGLFLSWIAGVVLGAWPGWFWLDALVIFSGCLMLALQARWLDTRRAAARG
jgi:hypothetical protein